MPWGSMLVKGSCAIFCVAMGCSFMAAMAYINQEDELGDKRIDGWWWWWWWDERGRHRQDEEKEGGDHGVREEEGVGFCGWRRWGRALVMGEGREDDGGVRVRWWLNEGVRRRGATWCVGCGWVRGDGWVMMEKIGSGWLYISIWWWWIMNNNKGLAVWIFFLSCLVRWDYG